MPLAVKSAMSSSTAANNIATATASKTGTGANHTTTTAKAMSAAPLNTRVMGEGNSTIHDLQFTIYKGKREVTENHETTPVPL